MAAERRQARLDAEKKLKAKEEKKGEEDDGCDCGNCCAIPIGRTAHFFDIDIVADISAHQTCWQLLLNEGNLRFGRLAGGDASHSSKTSQFFNVKSVPEVFAYFDAFSYDLSKMDLSGFRQNAMAGDIVGHQVFGGAGVGVPSVGVMPI